MKKILVLALTIMMVLALAACGEKAPATSGGTTDPGTSQQTQTPSAGTLFDIADSDIRVVTVIYPVEYTDDEAERAAVLDTIPSEIKKGIGTLQTGGFTNAYRFEGEGTTFTTQFVVTGQDEYNALKDYYKSLGGEVTVDNSDKFFEMEFTWGKLSQCEYSESSKTIIVTFEID